MDHFRPFQSIVNYFGPFWTILNQYGLFGPFWTSLNLAEPFWSNMVPYGPFWTFLDYFRPLLTILDHFGQFGPLFIIWTILNHFVCNLPFWTIIGNFPTMCQMSQKKTGIASLESDKPWPESQFGLIWTRPGDLVVLDPFGRFPFLWYLSYGDICVFGHLHFGDWRLFYCSTIQSVWCSA